MMNRYVEEVKEARMRVLTSTELDGVQGGICPVCVGMGSAFLFGSGGAAYAIYHFPQLLIFSGLSLSITVSVISATWYSNRQYIN